MSRACASIELPSPSGAINSHRMLISDTGRMRLDYKLPLQCSSSAGDLLTQLQGVPSPHQRLTTVANTRKLNGVLVQAAC
jgi:hypothetical protein